MTAWRLTAMQQSMVIHSLHEQARGIYVQQFVCRSRDHVSSVQLRHALDILCLRHDALRLQFDWSGPEITQSFADQVTIPLEAHAWEGEEHWQKFLQQDRLRGLDLKVAPLVRVSIFSGGPERTRFVITSHHALFDGRSRRVLMRELFELLRNPNPADALLPAAPLPFARYLEWNLAQDHSGSLPFWREYLADLPPARNPGLPEPERVPGTSVRGNQTGTISAFATQRLRSLAADCGCSLNNVIQGAWATVMARYGGTAEAVFGTTRACRVSAAGGQARDTIGLIMNSVPIRVKLPAGTQVRTLLKDLHRIQHSLRDHENTPISEMSRAAGHQGVEALFASYLMFDDRGSERGEEFPNWECELHEQVVMLNLSARAGTDILLSLDFDATVFRTESMARLLDDFSRVLDDFVTAPEREIDSLEAFTPSTLWGPKRLSQQFGNVVEAVRHWSQTTPDKPAIVSDSGTMTYADLEAASNKVAHHLIGLGVVSGSFVGVSIDRSSDLIIAFLAIWKAGCTYLPVDLRYPEERRAYMLADSRTATVLCSLPDYDGLPATAPDVRIANDGAAYAMYTSGSTGKPKGVLISHDSLANLCAAVIDSFSLSDSDRVLQASSINFDISVEEIFPTLWKGATVVPASHDATSSIVDFIDFVAKYQCTVLDIPTAFWHEIVVGLRESGRRLAETVRLLIVGGERALPELFAAWREMPEGSRVQWLNTYGPTEATVTATLYEPPASAVGGNLPIGHPLPGVNIYILDDCNRPTPLEVSGELFIGGTGVGLGYLNSPDLTEAKFVPDPFNPGARMYRTGDRARVLTSGEIEFLGRFDHQVKFRSYRIELGEIETAAEAHPDVLQAIAQVRDGTVLALFAATRSGSTLKAGNLQRWLSGKLVEWMVPTAVVLLDKLPVTPGGKIDRQALGAIHVEFEQTDLSQVPETDLERALLNIWEKLFRRSGFGIDDSFFALGGYSLLAMRLIIEIEKGTGHSLRFADLNRAPTIRQMARLLTSAAGEHMNDCLVVIRDAPGGGLPLFCFHGAGGAIHWYNDLALRITDRPIVGIQNLGVADATRPGTLEEACQIYMEAIRMHQPEGPYHFIGHSMGGMLAYHCALICERRGDTVAFAGTLDGWNRAADKPSTGEKLRRLFKYFWSLNRREKAGYIAEKLAWIRAARTQQKEMAAFDPGENAALDRLKAHNVQLARKYVAPPYQGTFHVFRARKRSATEDPDPSLGWAKVAGATIVTEVPGSHYTLLSPPNVDVLAQRIGHFLRSGNNPES